MKKTKQSPTIWFIADLHLMHTNILKHQANRIEAMGLTDSDDIEGHDKYILDLFKEQTKRGDKVYILGDFILSNQVTSLKLVNKIKSLGIDLSLVVGNHDKSTSRLSSMFESIDLIKVASFKKEVFPFIEEDVFTCVLCHYPMKSWPHKCQGAMQLYGHIHSNSPWCDGETDLAVNVGLDAPLSRYKLISLEEIYSYYKNKLNGLKPKDYIEKVSREDPNFIR